MSVDRSAHEATLRRAEAAFAQLQPVAAGLLLTRARALDALGRDAEARQGYLDLLRLDGRHATALTGLAMLLLRTGHRTAARSALARAVEAHPASASAHANLATVVADEDPRCARTHYERALELDPAHATAHRGLAVLLLRLGDRAEARRHASVGFRGHFDAWPFRGEGRGVTVLWVQSALGGNVPLEGLLDDHVFHRIAVAAELYDAQAPLPAHDVVLNALGDADRCGASLDAVDEVLRRSSAPLINPPSSVRVTGRVQNAERLAALPGVLAPRVTEWSRAALLAPTAASALADQGYTFPLLLRSPGFHTGENFLKVDAPAGLDAAVGALPGDALLVFELADTRGADGLYRKYRAMFVDGQLYPLHLAVSPAWKVHYFSSDMAERADHRREEEAFLSDMAGVLGPAAMKALEGVRDLLGLDYGGVDFAVDQEGRVVVFEANATMVIVPPGDDARWAYRVAPVARVRDAVVRMLVGRAGRAVRDAA